jgi:hypothetical protein
VNGIISVICLDGYGCACAAVLASTSAAARKAPILIITGFSRALMLWQARARKPPIIIGGHGFFHVKDRQWTSNSLNSSG